MSNVKQPAQFMVNEDGQRTAVVVDIEYWDALMHLLEDLEDVQLVKDMIGKLEQGPAPAGAIRWEDAKDELAVVERTDS